METQSTVTQQTAPLAVMAFFTEEESLKKAFQVVEELGYPPVSVTMAMAEKEYQSKWATPPRVAPLPHTDAQGGPEGDLPNNEDEVKSTKAVEGFALGATAGAGLGALALLGASVIVPGIVILGPLAASFVGAGTGATFGGLFGVLFGAGHPEEQIRDYEQSVINGKYMIRMSPNSSQDAEVIARQWRALGGDVTVKN